MISYLGILSPILTFARAVKFSLPKAGAMLLDEAFQAVPSFECGKDARALDEVELAVAAASKDPARREALEQRLLRALESAATRDARIFLCRQFRTIGTARCVPALEPLLTDPELSHMARYALGRIEDPAAAAALRRALGKTSGRLQSGLIYTLAGRDDREALPDIARLAGSQDPEVARAAAESLSRLGGPDAAKALEAARPKASKELRLAFDAALLRCADQSRRSDPAGAKAILKNLASGDSAPHLRKAAQALLDQIAG